MLFDSTVLRDALYCFIAGSLITQLLALLLHFSSGEPPVNQNPPLPSPQVSWLVRLMGHASHLPVWGLFYFLNLGDGIKDSFPCHYILLLFNNERGLFSESKKKTRAIYSWGCFITNTIPNLPRTFVSNPVIKGSAPKGEV